MPGLWRVGISECDVGACRDGLFGPMKFIRAEVPRHRRVLSSQVASERIREVPLIRHTKRVVSRGPDSAVLRETFLSVLNAETRSVGAAQITERTLEDWIFEDLFEGPTEKGLAGGGSEWRYSPAAIRAALEVVETEGVEPRSQESGTPSSDYGCNQSLYSDPAGQTAGP